MSGRRSSRSEGRPSGQRRERLSRRSRGRARSAGISADQDTDEVFLPRDASLELGDLGCGGFVLGLSLPVIAFGHGAFFESRALQARGLSEAERCRRVMSSSRSKARSSMYELATELTNVSTDSAPAFLAREETGPCRFAGSPQSSPHVELEARREVQVVIVERRTSGVHRPGRFGSPLAARPRRPVDLAGRARSA
jgi:hypothetical protein